MTTSLTIDELLTTTRSVRKRLDFSKPVARELIKECVTMAQQAPSGGNLQTWGFVMVTDPAKRTALADLYRKGYETFLSTPIAGAMGYGNPNASDEQKRVLASIEYLVDYLAQAPVIVIPCISPRLEGLPMAFAACPCQDRSCQRPGASCSPPVLGVSVRAGRSFIFTLKKRPPQLLGIPYTEVTQVALIPVAYTKGETFKPGPRQPVETMMHRAGLEPATNWLTANRSTD